jgi:hypothetical protein
MLESTAFAPDIVHCFEWQTAALVAAVASGPNAPATVFSAGEFSAGYRVDAAEVAGSGMARSGMGEIDLLDLGRHVATFVETTPRRGTLAALYDAALGGG